ncbi:hypothetical protein B0H13DRAFT_1879066 [Mycena leptocephala]|nr:hypothetical protein B0H13DRAFT_1879066 [Mycena leptocephala]
MFFSKLAALSALAFAAFGAAVPTPSSGNITAILTDLKLNLASTNANTAQPDIEAHITQLTGYINVAVDQLNAMGDASYQDIPLPALTALICEIISVNLPPAFVSPSLHSDSRPQIVIGSLTIVLKVAHDVAHDVPALLATVLPLVITAATVLLTFVTVICGRVVGLALIVIIAPVTALLATATALLGSLLGDALKCISGLTGHY